MRGEKLLWFLNKIGEGLTEFDDLLVGPLIRPHSWPSRERRRERRRARQWLLNLEREEARRLRHRLRQMVYRVKRDGLIVQKKQGDKSFFLLTKLGRKKREDLLTKKKSFSLYRKSYPKQICQELILIIFDIPEKEKEKREWLRAVLKNLGFRMIQKSVWIGQVKIPEELLDDLEKYNFLPYVHIFSIDKKGTLVADFN